MEHYDKDGYYIHPLYPTNKIHHTAIVGENVKLGDNNLIMPYAVIGQAGFIRERTKSDGVVFIGNNNVIGCYVNIMVGTKGGTVIGNDNLIMNHSNIGHNVSILNDTEVGAGTILNGHSMIGSKVKIKSGCIIRNRITIEKEITIGQGSNVTKDLKTAGTYYGNPAKLINRKYTIK